MRVSICRTIAGLLLIIVLGCVEEPTGPATTSPDPEPQGPPEVRVMSPNGGETYAVGDSMTVVVRVDSLQTVKAIDIDISVNGGLRWFDLGYVDFTMPFDTVGFRIPDTLVYYDGPVNAVKASAVSDSCVIRVQNYSETVADYSDGLFAIVP